MIVGMNAQMSPAERAASLDCWHGSVEPQPVTGGITNANFLCEDNGCRYFVRIGDDIAEHGVMRFNEIAASRAAAASSVSPAVVHTQPGAMVLEFIEGVTLTPEDVAAQNNLERIVPLIAKAHRDIPAHLETPALTFWVYQVIRTYAKRLRDNGSNYVGELDALVAQSAELERATGSIDLAFGHNDLLAANFIDDGKRLWLVDWDYAGFNSPLFDLGGLASNNGLTEDQERWVYEAYFAEAPDEPVWRAYGALKCASLLRETMWSMVSEIYSTLDFDYASYTRENLDKYRESIDQFGL